MAKVKKREIWVDNVKVIACVLVVLGHFFQSMTKAGVLPTNNLYQWFNQTIYYFHVPLFFICSGYLYQKSSKVEDVNSWKRNLLKKALNLGIPYFTFSFATWLLKTGFSGATNDKSGGLVDTLLLHPTSPYWYLYALFFVFLITPTFRNKTMAWMGLVAAVGVKVLGIVWNGIAITAISYVLSNEIWFVIGMSLTVWCVNVKEHKIIVPIAAGLIFAGLSVCTYQLGIQHGLVSFLMGLLACYSVLMFMMIVFESEKQLVVFRYLANYTMPIFLMHTLFAAPFRTVLFKLGIQNAAVHVVLGIAISFIGPIVAAMIMKKTKWLEFFLYPGKYIKVK